MFGTFWRHGSNLLLALVAFAAGAGMLAWFWPAPAWAWGCGAALFFVSEYGLHRYGFHAPPVRRVKFLLKLQHRLHYDHHAEPSRLDLLFLPPWFVLPNLGLVALAALAIAPRAACGALGGLAAAMLYYEWVHYLAHIPVRPLTPWGRWMKKYHLRHHFKNEFLWFGVTHPGFDMLLRSHADPAAAPKSPTVRNLHS